MADRRAEPCPAARSRVPRTRAATLSGVAALDNLTVTPSDSDPNLVVVGGMSGVGAKGALGYGVIATDLLLGRTEADPVYIAAREEFGFDRMQRDVASKGD